MSWFDLAHGRWLDPPGGCGPRAFQLLRSADVRLETMQIEDVAWLMSLPALECLQVHRLEIREKASWSPKLLSSNVQDITFEVCEMHCKDIIGLMSTCKALKDISLTSMTLYIDGQSDWFSFKQALDLHELHLKSLAIVGINADPDEDIVPQLSQGYFSQYSRLENLVISTELLFGPGHTIITQRLPTKSLRTLRVMGTWNSEEHGLKWLEELCLFNKSNSGRLESVHVSWDIIDFTKHEEWKRLQRTCASYGVDLEIWEFRKMDEELSEEAYLKYAKKDPSRTR